MSEVPGIKEVEAVLFASGKAMEEEHIKELTGLKPKETRAALEGLQKYYQERDTALFIWNQGSGWKINVKEDYVELVRTLAAETELSMPVLETLAVIAYRSPILQSDVIKARGDGAYEHVAELTDKGFITKEKYSRSYKLNIAEKFYHYFDVNDHKSIQDAFSDAKQPDPEAYARKIQKKLGKLQVVSAESDEEHEKAHKERQLEIYNIEQQREDDKKHFLNGFEDRLGEVKDRVDIAEQEIIEKKKESDARIAEREEAETEAMAPEGEKPEGEMAVEEEKSEKEANSEEEDAVTEAIEGASDEVPEPKKDYSEQEPQEFVKEIESQIDELTKKED